MAMQLERACGQPPAVQNKHLIAGNRLSQLGEIAVDSEPLLPDPTFDLAARPVTGSGKQLLNTLCHVLAKAG